MIKHRIEHPSAWTTAQLGKDQCVVELDDTCLTYYASVIDTVRDLPVQEVTLDCYAGAVIPPVMQDIKQALDQGTGLVVLRGVPVERWSRGDIEHLFWGLGLHLGVPASQSVMGDRLGHVVDVSDVDPNARAYRSQRELSLHHDFGDYHAMLSLSLPKSGGESRYASAITVHNIMLEEMPQHLDRLYQGYSLYRLGEQAEHEPVCTPHRVPVFSVRDGFLSSRFMRGFIEAAATLREQPLQPADIAALDAFEEISHRDEVMIEFTLEPGETALYNNLFVMHARAAFKDDKAHDIRRHLLRLWIYAEPGRPVVPEIEVFDSPGIPPQPGRSPSGEGEVLRALGASSFSRDATRSRAR